MYNKIIIILSFLFICIFQSGATDKRDFGILLNENSQSKILACQSPEFSFHLPQMAGNFRLGLSNGIKSMWANEVKKISTNKKKGRITYTLEDPFIRNGKVIITAISLSESNGIIIEVQAEKIPEDINLIWSFGGSYGKILEDQTNSRMNPEYCKYNVFSVERTSFTVYYGESMKLKVFMGVTPLNSDIRLSDAQQQDSPLTFFNSGKKTDAPALGASTPLNNTEKLYFCFYHQNSKADYNYFMLPALFKKESEK